MRPEVSIVVPTRDGIRSLPRLVSAIEAQRDPAPRELVVVDSGSRDGTREFARRVADVVVPVAPRSFNHGATRNLGIAHAAGRFIVLTVQDARPVGEDWLTRLLAPLRERPEVAGVFARQVPAPGASALSRHNLARWAASRQTPRLTRLDETMLGQLTPAERLDRCAFDHVCAALRREVWRRHPLPAAPIAEDLAWSRHVLLSGHAIAFAPDAVVEHSHDRGALYELKRTWALHQQLFQLFGLRAIPTPAALGHAIAATLAAHHRLARQEGAGIGSAAWRHAVALGVAWPVGQYLGGWTAAAGHTAWRPRGV